jgi:hypothetical protein
MKMLKFSEATITKVHIVSTEILLISSDTKAESPTNKTVKTIQSQQPVESQSQVQGKWFVKAT